jgi:UDP-N-acetylmuramoyl-tripeptide--D-alanyl-D-alanine ligase
MPELWGWTELVAAARGQAEGEPTGAVRGVAIDSRTTRAGDLFVALRAARDGHAFVPAAMACGAAAALVARDYVRQPESSALIRVADTLEGLAHIGRAARARSAAAIAAVTGSVGKTGTKEALRLCLERAGETHGSAKSYNNHWGVPLSLARMPRSARFAVFELGMNHPGEIAPLARLVRPHVAIVTAVEAVHLAHFASVRDIAEAKAEIFAGLAPGGCAVLPRDSAHFELLGARAAAAGGSILSFGARPAADVRLIEAELDAEGSRVRAAAHGRTFEYRVGAVGEHHVTNSLAVLAALLALGVDADAALPALEDARAGEGRGARVRLEARDGPVLLIDESYNANPASMRAALVAMATTPRDAFPRRLAVLGDMLELGSAGGVLHASLAEAIDVAGVDLVFACGPLMRPLFDALPAARRGAWARSAQELAPALLEAIAAGDVVMVKGSLGSRMAPLVAAVRASLERARPGGT